MAGIPDAVLEQEERVKRMIEEMNRPPQGGDGTSPVETEPQPTEPVQPTEHVENEDNLRAKYDTLSGKYNAEMGRLNSALSELRIENAELRSRVQLTYILLYHVVSGNVMAADVLGLTSAPTVLRKDLGISVKDGKVYLNEVVQVIITDIEASNGVIHVIDAVLLPPQ